MNNAAVELMDAYRREEELYVRVLQLVEEQHRAMKDDADVTAVFGLCSRVEDLLDEIAVIEDNIQPTKKQWQQQGDDLPDELESVLGRIQGLIEATAGKQGQVQQWLAENLGRRRQPVAAGTAGVQARQIRRSYGSQ